MPGGGGDSDHRIRQLEEKLDRIEKLLQKLEADRTQEKSDRDMKKPLDLKR